MYLSLADQGDHPHEALKSTPFLLSEAQKLDSPMAWSVQGNRYRWDIGEAFNPLKALKCFRIGTLKGDPKAQLMYGTNCLRQAEMQQESIIMLKKSAAYLNTSAFSL